MILKVKVNTNSKIENVEKLTEHSFIVRFKATRENGKANTVLINILANYFKVSKGSIKIIRGFTSTNKVVEIS